MIISRVLDTNRPEYNKVSIIGTPDNIVLNWLGCSTLDREVITFEEYPELLNVYNPETGEWDESELHDLVNEPEVAERVFDIVYGYVPLAGVCS